MEDKCSGESSKVSISCDIWPRDRPFCLFYCKFFVEFLPSNFHWDRYSTYGLHYYVLLRILGNFTAVFFFRSVSKFRFTR